MKTVVISLGGSIIVPSKIDSKFLAEFKKIILSYVKKGYRFIIYCGGGTIARMYQSAITTSDNSIKDEIGIVATVLNATLVQKMFGSYADKRLIGDPNKFTKSTKKILVASGYKPGRSTDYGATLIAKKLNAHLLINMTNVGYVYDKDPKLKGARKIKEISWQSLRKLVGSKWSPGLNMPFDPIASKLAQKNKLTVIITGSSIKNLKNILDKKSYLGTTIR